MDNRSRDTATQEIAAHAARLVVEEGLEYGPAKKRAVRDLGLGNRAALPDNDLLEDEVRDYISIFHAETQPAELLALRRLALVWMERLKDFRPHLGGAVWHGTATHLSDIYLQLFCDDSKEAEIRLLDKGVDYEVGTLPGLHGELVDVLSVHAWSDELDEDVGLHLLIYGYDDLRGALKPDSKGRTPRGTTAAVERLLAEAEAG